MKSKLAIAVTLGDGFFLFHGLFIEACQAVYSPDDFRSDMKTSDLGEIYERLRGISQY